MPTPLIDEHSTTSAEKRKALNEEERRLNINKLMLEERVLIRQLSLQSTALEWIKALTFPVALMGLLGSFWIGWNQIKQSQETRDNERFDKALTRVGSKDFLERLTGVSGLRLFLNEGDKPRQSAALHFLVNAVANENDPQIRSAILDAFSDIKTPPVNHDALSSALVTAIEKNRVLYSAAKNLSSKRRFETERSILAGRFESELSPQEKLKLARNEKTPLGKLNPNELETLEATASVIGVLVRKGGYAQDMSGIYCRGCNFSLAQNLDNVSFDRAELDFAEFTYSSLRGASFDGATLHYTGFYGADLRDATLRSDKFNYENNIFGADLNTIGSAFSYQLPIFECADLRAADLRGRALVTGRVSLNYDDNSKVSDSNQRFEISITLASMQGAKLDNSTKLSPLGVLWSVALPDSYEKQLELPINTYLPIKQGSYPMQEYAINSNMIGKNGYTEPWGIGRTGEFFISDKTKMDKNAATLPLFLAVIAAGKLPVSELPMPIRTALSENDETANVDTFKLYRAESDGCDRTKWPQHGFRGVNGSMKASGVIAPPEK